MAKSSIGKAGTLSCILACGVQVAVWAASAPSAFGTTGATLAGAEPPRTVKTELAPAEEEIGLLPYVAGGVVGSHAIPAALTGSPQWLLVPGLGLGHLVQGRFLENGWIFTASQVGVGLVALAANSSECKPGPCNNEGLGAAVVFGIMAEIGLHAWEVADLWIAPPLRNARIRRERAVQVGIAPAPGGALLSATLPF